MSAVPAIAERRGAKILAHIVFWALYLSLTACQPLPAPSDSITAPSTEAVVVSTIRPTSTATPTAIPASATLTPVASITPAPSIPATPQVCSPLQDVEFEELPAWVVNPFNPPRPGSDDPHQGLDLAQLDSRTNLALTGWPVQAVLTGRVAMVLQDRFPYGNAILIASNFEQLPVHWQQVLPAAVPVQEYRGALTCPAILTEDNWGDDLSIYILYAHLENPPNFKNGQTVECGQQIGRIGVSGNALNPHVHLEIRAGPAAAQFESMAHYTGNATPAEMSAYCTWRIGGQFQLLDPTSLLLSQNP